MSGVIGKWEWMEGGQWVRDKYRRWKKERKITGKIFVKKKGITLFFIYSKSLVIHISVCLLLRLTMLLLRVTDYLTRTPVLGVRNPFMNSWSGRPNRLHQNNTGYCYYSVASQSMKANLYCWRHCPLWTQNVENSYWVWHQNFFLKE